MKHNHIGLSADAVELTHAELYRALRESTGPSQVEPSDFLPLRSLELYSVADLKNLFLGISIAIESLKTVGDKENISLLDIWAYRVRDAIKEATQRETDLPY